MDVLIGVVSPAGRLPNTWPASLDQVGQHAQHCVFFDSTCIFYRLGASCIHAGSRDRKLHYG